LKHGEKHEKEGEGREGIENVDTIKMMGIALMIGKITQSERIRVYMVENILTYSCKATLIFTN
jgi:hypothetical protein